MGQEYEDTVHGSIVQWWYRAASWKLLVVEYAMAEIPDAAWRRAGQPGLPAPEQLCVDMILVEGNDLQGGIERCR